MDDGAKGRYSGGWQVARGDDSLREPPPFPACQKPCVADPTPIANMNGRRRVPLCLDSGKHAGEESRGCATPFTYGR
jgi:hypothetical protein